MQRTVKTTCPYCGVGCGIEAEVSETEQIRVQGDRSHLSNLGKLCSKGQALAETLVEDNRLLHPVIEANTAAKQVSWDMALDHVAGRLSAIRDQHGADALAFYVSGQLLTEDYYVANKLMKGFIGSANIDTNSRLCMASSVAGHKRAFGADVVPGCYQDLELADLVVLVGSNLAWCHPVLFQRIRDAKQQRPAMQIVVIDPRKTDSCYIADQHLALKPGTDVTLFNGLLSYLAEHGLINTGFLPHTAQLEQSLEAAQAELGLARQLGLQPDELETFYHQFAHTEKVVTVYSQGVNQSSQGVDKVNAILNCHLATGRVGKPGMGPFSVTGQPNAMGGREVGGLANTLAAHMDFTPANIERVGRFWQADEIAQQPGLKAVDMFEAIRAGKIKAVWIMATNPAVSLPNSAVIREALQHCEFVVVSDCVSGTDTQQYADVLLPAQGWGEKQGTVTNSERRISRQRRLVTPQGEAKADWWIMCEVARRMGFAAAFDYHSEAEIFREHAALSGFENDGQRAFDISGYAEITNDQYAELHPFQWPARDKNDLSQHKRLFGNGQFVTPDQRAKLIPVRQLPAKSQVKAEFPYLLNTGRERDQWHTMTRTGLSATLCALVAEPCLAVHPQDAEQLELTDGTLASVASAQGEILCRVALDSAQRRGEVFMPIHWSHANSSHGVVSLLVGSFTDPLSGQPESKYTAVSIQRWDFNSEALLLVSEPLELVNHPFEYWVQQKVTSGYLYRIGAKLSPPALDLALSSMLSGGNGKVARQGEKQRAIRWGKLVNSRLDSAAVISRQLQHDDLSWFALLLDQQLLGNQVTAALASVLSGSPQGALAEGRRICACKQVGEYTLRDAIVEQGCTSVDKLTECTSAGSGCGSCIPELSRLIDRYQVVEVT